MVELANKHSTQAIRSNESKYRRDVLAEIIDYGHAAYKNEWEFQNQVSVWNLEFSEIPTDRLLGCFIEVSRGRVLTFDAEPLTANEMMAAWKNLSRRKS